MDRFAELAAIEDFDWIVEDDAEERILADTHAAYAGEIAALRAEYALGVDPERVGFEFGTDGSLWVRTDLRSAARSSIANLSEM